MHVLLLLIISVYNYSIASYITSNEFSSLSMRAVCAANHCLESSAPMKLKVLRLAKTARADFLDDRFVLLLTISCCTEKDTRLPDREADLEATALAARYCRIKQNKPVSETS